MCVKKQKTDRSWYDMENGGQAKENGFRVMQFNAVVANNTHALHLYERIGFNRLGVIPQGFRMPDGHYEDIIPHYYVL